MPDYVYLRGVEEVQNASHRMMEAATKMAGAAYEMECSLARHAEALAAITYRNEQMVDRLVQALEKHK